MARLERAPTPSLATSPFGTFNPNRHFGGTCSFIHGAPEDDAESTQIPNIEVECWGRLSMTVYTSRGQGSQSTRAQRLSGADQRQLHKLAVHPGVV